MLTNTSPIFIAVIPVMRKAAKKIIADIAETITPFLQLIVREKIFAPKALTQSIAKMSVNCIFTPPI